MTNYNTLTSEFETQLVNEITIDSNGIGRVTIRGVARLAGIVESSIRRAFEGAAQNPSKLAEMLICQGFECGTIDQWSEKGIPDIAVGIILEYYAFEAGRYCTLQAANVFRAFSRIGIRMWIQKLKGQESEENKIAVYNEDVINEIFKLLKSNQQDIKELKDKNKLLESVVEEKNELKKEINTIKIAANNHRGSMNVIEAEIEIDDTSSPITVKEFLKENGLSDNKAQTIALRTAEFYKASHHHKPDKNKLNRYVYSGADTQYIKEAIKSETGIILTKQNNNAIIKST